MTTKTDDFSSRVIRCAVCKIDLKGRFVFVDDTSEQLFGHTKEDLFGKFFIDFVDEADKGIISLILHKRNHYESFFDSTQIRFVGPDRRQIHAAVIISLNFIAGNPVNFQIIINTEVQAEMKEPVSAELPEVEPHFAELLECDASGDWKRVCGLLSDLSKASWVLIYRVTRGEFEPLACKSPTEPEALGFSVAPELASLHRYVIETETEYDFTDHEMVRLAIERDGVAPNEYVTLFSFGGNESYLLRLVFSDAQDTQLVGRILTRVQLFVRLLVGLRTKPAPLAREDGPAIADRDLFKGMCDDLQIGVCFAKSLGTVTDWNMTFATMLGSPENGETLTDVVESLKERNRPEIVNGLLDYLLLSPGRTRAISATSDVILPDGETVRVSLRQQADSIAEDGLQMILMPLFSAGGDKGLREINSAAFSSILTELQSPLTAAARIAEKLGHEFFNQLGRDGNLYLQGLGEKMNRVLGMLGDLSSMATLLNETENVQIIDLNLLAARAVEEVSSLHPTLPIRVHYHDLPKIATHPRKLATVLRLVLSNSVRFADEKGADVTISAELTNESCVLSMADTGPGIPAKYLSKVTDFFYRVPDPRIQTIPGRGTGLAIARQLLAAIGGGLGVISKTGRGTTVYVTVPIV